MAADSDPEPLQLSYFEANKESFSAGIVRALKGSAFFRPRMRKDGTISDKDMLLVASTVIAAADRHIRESDDRSAALQERLSWWNTPMFQNALPAPAADKNDSANPETDAEKAEKAESNWLVRHLTIRNLCSVLIVVCSSIWVLFTWYSSDKNAQLEHVKSLLAASEKRVADGDLSKAQLEKDFAFYKDNVKDASANTEKLKTENARLKGEVGELDKSLAVARAETKQLIDKLAATKVVPPSPAPNPPTKPASI